MEDLKKKVLEQIEEQQAILDASTVTVEEMFKIAEKAPSLDDFEDWVDFWKARPAALTTLNAHRTLTRFKETLKMDLVKPSTRYVLTDSNLCSPSGYVFADGVFIKNHVWIETDRLPRSTNLKVFDLQKLRSKDAVYHNGEAA